MPTAERDYYEVLGVPRSTDAEGIKRAFRARAREWHPDVAREAESEERFRELARAYEVLSNPARRLLYDRFSPRGRGDRGPAHESVTRWGSRRRAPAPAGVEVALHAWEAERGTRRELTLELGVDCRACGGSGGAAGAVACSRCSGLGRLRRVSARPDQRLLSLDDCSTCGGTGRIGAACADCAGSGHARERRRATVTVPAGARDGDRVPLGPAGGAFAVLRVRPAPADSLAVRAAATIGLVLASALLAALLFLAS
jgi:molecular chaperone DnaJ